MPNSFARAAPTRNYKQARSLCEPRLGQKRADPGVPSHCFPGAPKERVPGAPSSCFRRRESVIAPVFAADAVMHEEQTRRNRISLSPPASAGSSFPRRIAATHAGRSCSRKHRSRERARPCEARSSPTCICAASHASAVEIGLVPGNARNRRFVPPAMMASAKASSTAGLVACRGRRRWRRRERRRDPC